MPRKKDPSSPSPVVHKVVCPECQKLVDSCEAVKTLSVVSPGFDDAIKKMLKVEMSRPS